jgi:hypothetical protein
MKMMGDKGFRKIGAIQTSVRLSNAVTLKRTYNHCWE